MGNKIFRKKQYHRRNSHFTYLTSLTLPISVTQQVPAAAANCRDPDISLTIDIMNYESLTPKPNVPCG